MSYEQGSQIDTDYRIQQIQPVDGRDIEVGHEQFPNLINDPVEHIGSHCREEAHEETKQKGELLIGNMLLTPLQETLQGRVDLSFPDNRNHSLTGEFDDARRRVGIMLLSA